jgi:hypothetical protein
VHIAVVDRESVASAPYLHRIAVANSPLPPEQTLGLYRAADPAELAVGDAQPLYRARANAVQIWGGCDGFTVDNCYVHDVYDAGLTQQINVEKPDEARDQRHVCYSRNVIENCNYSIEYFLSLKGEARVSNPSRMEDFVIEGNLMRNAGKGFCRQRPDHSQAAHIKSWRNGANRATGYAIRDNVFAFGDEMLVEISSGLSNPDGSDSMPEMKGNVFIGREGQRFGVLNQGKPAERVYDENIAASLGEKFSANVFATR